jgi:hypothetical protein
MDGQPATDEDDALRNPTVIYSARSPQQAHLLKNLLVEAGIAAQVTNDVLTGGSGVDLVGLPTAAKVQVPKEDAETARRFAVEFDRQTAQPDDEAELPEPEPGPSTWPQCPDCDARRSTRCPVCQTAGTDFAEADPEFLGSLGLPDGFDPGEEAEQAAPASCDCGSTHCGNREQLPSEETAAIEPAVEASPDAVLQPRLALTCSTCDEPFVPEFPRRCEWCGHEFPDGYDLEALPEGEHIPTRIIVVVCALVGLMLLGTLYFMWIV